MKQKSWICALMGVLLSVCFAFLGLFGALELTLFDSGNLIQCMDETGYIDEISNIAQITCQSYVTSAGLNTVALEGYLAPEAIRREVQRGVAERYRGSSTSFYQAHFDGFAERIRSSLSPEELAAESEDSLARFNLLQGLCETAFREITRPPFDAALNCVLQYRAYRLWAYLVLLLLGVSAYLLLRRSVPNAQVLRRRLSGALCSGALALAILGALLRWALPFASWMPKENLSYPLFCMWWSGFAMTTVIAGLLMLAAGLVWSLWGRSLSSAALPLDRQTDRTNQRL